MNSNSDRLRALIESNKIIKVGGAFDAMSAKLVENNGFDAIWAGSFSISAINAVPDASILTMTEFFEAASKMAYACNIPVIADCDTGYGGPDNVRHLVKKYENAGIAGISIEDKVFPKQNSLLENASHELLSEKDFVDKIIAAVESKQNKNFLIIARVEALISGMGMDEALKRASAYERAGADAILIHSKQKTPDEIFQFMELWNGKIPIVVVPTTYDTVKIDDLNLDSFDYNTPSARQGFYTSYTGSFNFTTGSNHFMFVPKYSENCVTINSTVFDGDTLIPVESASSWQIKKASDIEVGDKYLSSSMDKGTVGSVGAASNQDLVHFLITYPQGNPDMYYHRNVFCDGILTLVENKMYTVNSPAFGAATGSTSASNAEINSYVSTSIQQWELLNHNSVNGTLFNGSNYSGTVARYSENILNRIVSQFSSSVWEW